MRLMTAGRKRILGERAARFSKVGLARRCGSGRSRPVGVYTSMERFLCFSCFKKVAAFFHFLCVTYIYPLRSAIRWDGPFRHGGSSTRYFLFSKASMSSGSAEYKICSLQSFLPSSISL